MARLVLAASAPILVLAIVAMYTAGWSGYLIWFFALISIGLIGYCVFTIHDRADFQLRTLTSLIEAMIGGDYSLRGREQPNPAFAELLSLVNQLAETLESHKLQAHENQLLLTKVLEQMDAMVFAVNPDSEIELINDAARQLLLPGKTQGDRLDWDVAGLATLRDASDSGIVTLEQHRHAGDYFLFKDRFLSDGRSHDLYLLTRADRLLRERERASWQSLLRVLSHELNNSLTPIATFSRSMLKRLEREPSPDPADFSDGLQIIRERAESLNRFISSYSQITQLPMPNRQPFRWQESLTRLAELTGNCRVEVALPDDPVRLFADPQQLEQVFINLLKNASEAMTESEEKVIVLSARVEPDRLHIEIGDRGTGIANAENLFVPFYTTRKSGSGIGLSLCRQILLNHDGTITLRNRTTGPGAIATISLPMTGHLD